MQRVVANSAQLPIVREVTVSIMNGLPNNAIREQVGRVIRFVRDRVTYIRDPEGSEYLVAPERLLQSYLANGYMAGDCDDHVMLLNAMLGSIGVSTKAVGVKFGGSGEFNHVISGIYLGGNLMLVDPCAKGNTQPAYYDTLIV